MGDAVNLASRMEEAAEPGTVLITEDTHRLIAPMFETESLGPIEVRGKAEPVPVYRALSTKAVAGKPRGIAGLESPLVGRDAELQGLREVLERLQAGVGGIVTIVGEAGIGKSRLVAELQRSAISLQQSATAYPDDRRDQQSDEAPQRAVRTIRWVEGRCLSYGESMAYLPWVDMLHGLLGMSVEDTPLAVRGALHQLVETVCPDQFDEVYPYLGRMMSLPLEDEAETTLRGLDAETLKLLTIRAMDTMTRSAANERPLVVVCEDLHWADPSSLELLEHLMGLADRASLLLICAFRPYRDHGCWRIREMAGRSYPHRHIDLLLAPLSAADSEVLVGNLLRVEALPRPLRMRILDHAEGNPFYVEEVIRSLIDSGAIVYDEAMEQWEAIQRVEDITIPDTLQGVLMARIDRLQEDARRVLQMASVIGRIFPYRVLVAIAHEEKDLDHQLSTLQREEMIRQRARVPEPEYIFKHHLAQQAAYSGLLRSERRRLHRQVAEALKRLLPDRIEEQLGLLAHHWEGAGEREQAIEYLRRAGEQAAGQFANAEAIGYFTRALDLTPQDDLVGRYGLLLVREGVHSMQAELEAWRQDLADLQDLARAIGEDALRAEVALRQCHCDVWAAHYGDGIGQAQEAVRLAQAVGDPGVEAAAYMEWGRALAYQGDRNAAPILEQALTFARAANLRRVEAGSLQLMIEILYPQGDFAGARAFLEQSSRIFREIGDRREVAHTTLYFGGVALGLGDYDEARTHYEQGIAEAQEIGARSDETFMRFLHGTVHHALGNYEEARTAYEQYLLVGHALADRRGETHALNQLGLLSHHVGDNVTARGCIQRALQLAQEQAGQGLEVFGFSLICLGHVVAKLGRLDEACAAYGRGLDRLRQLGQSLFSMDALAGLARVHLAQNDLPHALVPVEEILCFLEEHALGGRFLIHEPFRIYLTCYRVLLASGDPRAGDILEEAYRLLQTQAANLSDEEERGSFLEKVAANREIVREWAGRGQGTKDQ